MKPKLIFVAMALVIVPTAILSIMAGGAVSARELEFDRRITASARQAVDSVQDTFYTSMRAVYDDAAGTIVGLMAETKSDGLLPAAVRLKGMYDLVGQICVIDSTGRILYPPEQKETLGIQEKGSADLSVLIGGDVLDQKGDREAAAAEYQRIMAQPGVSPVVRAEAAIRSAKCYRALGKRDFAAQILRQVAGYSSGALLARKLQGESSSERRDGRGYLYSFLALKDLADTYREAEVDDLEHSAKWKDLKEMVLLEIMDRLVFVYEHITLEQRDGLLTHVKMMEKMPSPTRATSTSYVEKAEKLTMLLEERLRSRSFHLEYSASLQEALRSNPPGQAPGLLSSADDLWMFGKTAGEEGIIVGYLIESTAVDRLVQRILSDVGAQHGLDMIAEGFSALGDQPDEEDLLASGRMPDPFGDMTITAYAANRNELKRSFELQTRLQEWGILILVLGTLVGVWTVLRYATLEVRKARARGDFIAGISHDLRTPLASMRMLAESLSLGRVPDEDKKKAFLDTIVQQSQRLGHMVERVLFFVRLGEDALTYNMRDTAIGELVDEAVDSCSVMLGVSIEKQIEPGLPNVNADPDAIGQVLLNLLDNAVKYSKSEMPHVSDEIGGNPVPEIRVSAHQHGKNEVSISVSDRGPGMTPDEVKNIFKRYYRSDHRRDAVAGLGLGLALCRHVIRAHDGRIEVESKLGEGSTFRVILPSG